MYTLYRLCCISITMNNEERIIELETRMSYAETTMDELNKTIVSQNREIENLKFICSELKKRIDDLRDSGNDGPMEHSRPPHY